MIELSPKMKSFLIPIYLFPYCESEGTSDGTERRLITHGCRDARTRHRPPAQVLPLEAAEPNTLERFERKMKHIYMTNKKC